MFASAMEGKPSWWMGRASNPVGGAMRCRVGSTPIPLRRLVLARLLRSRILALRCSPYASVRLRCSGQPAAARDADQAQDVAHPLRRL